MADRQLASADFGWYRRLLKFYPRTYRQEYEEEMVSTLRQMFRAAPSPAARRQVLKAVLKDYCSSLPRQNWTAAENSFYEMPARVKRDTIISIGLIAPFCAIFMYNAISLWWHHSVELRQLEAHTWIIYTVVLPLLALFWSLKLCVSRIFGLLIRGQWAAAARAFVGDWLFLGVGVAILAIIAIC